MCDLIFAKASSVLFTTVVQSCPFVELISDQSKPREVKACVSGINILFLKIYLFNRKAHWQGVTEIFDLLVATTAGFRPNLSQESGTLSRSLVCHEGPGIWAIFCFPHYVSRALDRKWTCWHLVWDAHFSSGLTATVVIPLIKGFSLVTKALTLHVPGSHVGADHVAAAPTLCLCINIIISN